MRDKSEVEARVEDLLYSEVKRRIQNAAERLPHKCVHNYRHPLDSRKKLNGELNPSYNRVSNPNGLPVLQSVGLCMLGSENPKEWSGTICDDPIDAKRCPYFSPSKDEAIIREEVLAQVQDVDWVRANMPDVYALLWVLGDISIPKLTWWRKLLLKATRVKTEPLAPQFDVSKLLPSDTSSHVA